MRKNSLLALLAAALLSLGACGSDAPPEPGERVAISVAPLDLPGVTDVAYTLSVTTAGGEVVWTKAVTSTAYGDGSGAISYVGPCDADPAENPNTVAIVIDALLANTATLQPGVDYINPAPASAPVTREITCEPDRDVPVDFDLTVMRRATQGFFDVAVAFDDIFCSAKLDCERSPGQDLDLLFHPQTGERDQTVVLGFACTAGLGSPTYLHMDDVVVTCGTDLFVVDAAGGPGNLNPPFPFVDDTTPNTTDLVFQAATYRGIEQLGTLGTSYHKTYWNIAIGLNAAALANLGACTLTTRATATDEALPGGELPLLSFSPYVTWDVDLTDASGARICTSHALFDDTGVAPVYTDGVHPIAFGASYDDATQSVVDHAPLIAQSRALGEVEPLDLFGDPLLLADFDADGLADLAVTALGEDDEAGAVSVFSGVRSGVDSTGFTFDATALGGATTAGDLFGAALAAGDFNGDGYLDLAIGSPGTTSATSDLWFAAPGLPSAEGALWVVPGTATGLDLAAATPHTRETLSCGATGTSDAFGAALAAGDFDGNGLSDLAIGIPGANGGQGAICVVTGSAGGLSSSKVFTGTRGTLTGATPAAGDHFGAVLTAGRLDTDAYADLAVGAPGDSTSAGAVEVLKGQSSGAFFGTGIALTQGDATGTNEGGDGFGSALTVGDLDGDGVEDLFVGAPGDRPTSLATGGVYGFFGPVAPLNTKNAAYAPETYAPLALHTDGARYGASLATPDLDGDGYDELVIGEPGASDTAGRYNLLRGSPTGAGVGGSVEASTLGLAPIGGEELGAALASGDVNGDGYGDFVIGAPGARPASRPAGGEVVFVAGKGDGSCIEGGCGGSCGECPLNSQVCVNGACDLDYQYQAKSTYPHTIDGLFTDWDQADPPPRWEWSELPFVAADFTDVKLDYDGSALYVMNDWYLNDALPLEPGCYNLFVVYTEGGAKQWQIKLFADGAPQVFLNGEPVDPADVGVEGAYTFGPSPAHPDDHTIFELKIPTGAGSFGAVFEDPGPGSSCDELLTEPTTFVGRALADGGLELAANTDVPWLFGANGTSAEAGGVALVGVGLGSGGTATLGGQPAPIRAWSTDTVLLGVPTGADSSGIALDTVNGQTNTLRFDPAPSAAVLNPKSDYTHVVDGQMTGWTVDLPSHEWADVVPVMAGDTAAVYADFDGATLHLLFDWLDATHPLTDAHIRGWTGGGSGVVGGPDHLNGANDGAALVQWDIVIDDGVATVLRDGVVVADLGAAGVSIALGSGGSPNDPTAHPGLEIDLPADSLGFGFEIVGGGDLTKPTTLASPDAIVTGVADPKSGLYVRAVTDPTLLSLSPLTAPIGTTVTLGGANLGDGTSGHIIVGGGVEATPTSWDAKSITFAVPSGADTGLVRVTYDDGRASNGLQMAVVCGTGADCPSGVCTDGACEAASCTDTLKNGDETDVDCGGACPACGDSAACLVAADCQSLVCTGGVCAAATCSDGVKNQGETDVDCGGPCDACGAGLHCATADDCVSQVCTLGVCKVATCFDGVLNQNETDVDCGGLCAACATGSQCSVDTDCAYGTCVGGVCTCTPACDGKVCGPDSCGGECGTCPGVQTCQSSGTLCDFEYTVVPDSDYAHTVDGQFTDWNPEDLPTFYEWYDVPPAIGVYTNAYFDFTGTTLYVLNDWHYNDGGTIDPSCYNLFLAYTGGGAERWQVKVFADGTVQVFLNGALLDPDAAGVDGAYGYHASPLVQDVEHTIYELALPASPGRFAMQLHDPGPSSGCATLYREPVSFVGDTTTGGGLKIAENPDVPWIPGLNPSRGVEGTLVQVYGVSLGSSPGTLVFGGVTTTAESWTDTEIRVRVPAGADDSGVVVTTVDGYSTNPMPFDVIPFGDEPGAVLNGPSSYPHTIDGEFTDWPGDNSAAFEWSDIIPARGQYTYAYFDFDGTALYIMNDWYANPTAPVSSECYNQFFAYTGGGTEQWDVKVYGDQTVTVALNGVALDLASSGVEGATGFHASPLEPAAHSIFELKLPVSPGGWGLQLHDPGGQNPGTPGFTCEGNLLSEPSNFKGVLDPKGGNYVIPSTTPTIFALQPPKAAPGDTVTLIGGGLGATAGSVVFAPGVTGTVTGWTDTEVLVTVPAGAETGLVEAVDGGGVHSNGLLFRRICHTGADCESGVCVAEECQLPTCTDSVSNGDETGVDCGGGTCPLCPAGQGCATAADCATGICTGGLCASPSCSDGVRNGDESDVDCGGSCDGCLYTQLCAIDGDCQSGNCDAGICRPSAGAVATSVPSPVGSFQQDVAVTVRVSDLGLDLVTQARVEAPLGWLLPDVGAGVSAKLADGTDVTGQLTVGASGAGAHGGTYYTLTGLGLSDVGTNPYVDFVFAHVQAQEQTGSARWYVDVEEGLGWGRVSPTPTVSVVGAIADGSGDGIIVASPSPLPAGTADATVTVTLTNTLTEYVNNSASDIFSAWTNYGDANWSLTNNATYGQVLLTADNTAYPSYFVSNDLLYDGILEVGIGALTTSDDDFIGMVFRWQDRGNYYLLDWKQAAQANGASGTARAGLVLRAVRNYDFNADGVYPDNINAATLWGTESTRSDIIGFWGTGWADNHMYALRVVLDGPHIQVYVDGTLRMDVTDYTFAGGRYGPYTYSQPQTAIKDLKVYRDTITNETVTVEVPDGWPLPVPGTPPAGNLIAAHQGTDVTSLLTVGPTGAAAHGGTLITATPLSVLPGESLVLTFGPIQVPPYPGTETWYMQTAGVGGVLTDLAIQPTLTITP